MLNQAADDCANRCGDFGTEALNAKLGMWPLRRPVPWNNVQFVFQPLPPKLWRLVCVQRKARLSTWMMYSSSAEL